MLMIDGSLTGAGTYFVVTSTSHSLVCEKAFGPLQVLASHADLIELILQIS